MKHFHDCWRLLAGRDWHYNEKPGCPTAFRIQSVSLSFAHLPVFTWPPNGGSKSICFQHCSRQILGIYHMLILFITTIMSDIMEWHTRIWETRPPHARELGATEDLGHLTSGQTRTWATVDLGVDWFRNQIPDPWPLMVTEDLTSTGTWRSVYGKIRSNLVFMVHSELPVAWDLGLPGIWE